MLFLIEPTGPRSDGYPLDDGSRPPPNAGPLGMKLFLLSLAIVFAGTLVAYTYLRLSSPKWPSAEQAPLPDGLVLSTIVIVASSFTLLAAAAMLRARRQGAFRGFLLITTLLGLGFLGAQTLNWVRLYDQYQRVIPNQSIGMFHVLTVLHALHVVGGVIALVRVTTLAWAGRYTPQEHAGVRYCAWYWHFLDVVWLVMLAVLYVSHHPSLS